MSLTALAAAAAMSACAMFPPPRLSEIRVDSLPPVANIEFVEISGLQGMPLDGLALVVIGDDDDLPGPTLGNSGVVEAVVPLDGVAMPADNTLLVHGCPMLLEQPDLVADLNLEDGDNLTVLLVRGAWCAAGDDLDAEDDGALDESPWKEIVDAVGIIGSPEGAMSEWTYADARVGPNQLMLVFQIRRCLDTGDWSQGSAYFVSSTGDSAGRPNPPCAGMLCTADLDQDGAVGSSDLTVLLSEWGMVGSIADVDGDGLVGSSDITVLLTHWGPCPL